MLIGASTGTTIAPEIQFTALYTRIAITVLGKVGGYLFAGALFFAALTTAIGMTAGCAEFFVDMSDGKFSYKQFCVVILVLSTIFGCMGLASILGYLGPILDGIYPAAIVLVLYYTFMPNSNSPKNLGVCSYGMTVALVFGVLQTIYTYGIKFNVNLGFINTLYEALPLSSQSLAWFPWTAVACVVGYIVCRNKKDQAA